MVAVRVLGRCEESRDGPGSVVVPVEREEGTDRVGGTRVGVSLM